MAVLIDAYSVVVRNSSLAALYPGGIEAYERDRPNATFCTDGRVSRIGFMVLSDAKRFVAELAAKGLTPARGGSAEDVAIVSQPDGLLQPCEWLQIDHYRGVMIAWLAGSEKGDLYAPPGWTFDTRLERRLATEIGQNLEFVRSEDSIDVYREIATGRELFVGRTASFSPADHTHHNELCAQANALIQGLILLDGPAPGLDAEVRGRLEASIPLFEEAIRIKPGDFSAMWLLGKVYQRFDDYGRALEWFSRAHRVNPDQPDVAREASIASMELGRPQEAIPFCERAIGANPDDPGLRANLALALLFSEKPAQAKVVAADAMRLGPDDQITAQIAKFIDEVLNGTRPCPHHIRDLQSGP